MSAASLVGHHGWSCERGSCIKCASRFPVLSEGGKTVRKRNERRDGVSDADFEQALARAYARGEDGIEDAQKTERGGDNGTLVDLGMRRTSLKLEQNLGCELPVCVANNSDTKRKYIEVVTDGGVVWRLTRQAGGRLPAPEHYGYWLWFLDRCQAAAEAGHVEPPRLVVNPTEIFDLFGAPKRSKKSGYNGSLYDALDAAFSRFATLTIGKRTAFFDGNRTYSGHAELGTLCYYASWRSDTQDKQQVRDLGKAWVKPGTLLWESIRAGYLKSVPLEPIKHLTYVERRLFTYLSKHCKPRGEFAISPDKLLPKIPLYLPSNLIKSKLGPKHEQLARVGFLRDANIEGRGKNKLIVYRRTSRGFQSTPLHTTPLKKALQKK